MKSPTCFSGISERRGFSLVEVTLAVGVISFAMMTSLTLLPVGLQTLREATDTTTMSQIMQRLSSQARMTEFSDLSAQFSGRKFYFDESGTFLTNSPAAAPAKTRYWAETEVAPASFPGSQNVAAQSPLDKSLQAISVRVISAPSESAKIKSTNHYQLLVPNSGG